MTTTVTIELTDTEVADLRHQPPYSGPGWQVPIINRICAALPPEPVRLTIELEPDVAGLLANTMSVEAGEPIRWWMATALNQTIQAAKETAR